MLSLRSTLLAAASAAMFAPAALAAPDASFNAFSPADAGFVLATLSKDANEAKQSSRNRDRGDRGARGGQRGGDGDRGSRRGSGSWRGGDDNRSGAGASGHRDGGGGARVRGEDRRDDQRAAGWRGGDDRRGDGRGPGARRGGDDNRGSTGWRGNDNRGSSGYRGVSPRPTHTPRPNYSPRRGGHSDWYSRHGRWTYYSGGRWNPWTETRFAPRPHWRYHTRYYSLGYNRHDFRYYDAGCRASGNQVVAGALIGALFGGAVADDAAAGMLIGGLLGAGIGASLNDCDRGQYYYAAGYSFTHGSPYYWGNPYSGVRGVVIPRGYYNYGGMRCRYGDAEVFMPDGRVVYDTVRMCQDRYGRWQVARRQ